VIESGDCSIASVMPDGSLMLEQRGGHHHARIHGIDVPQPPPSLYTEIVGERVGGAPSPLRCELVHGGSPASVRLRYLAWHDKSGEVWRDLAITLLGHGLAVTSAESFPDRPDYLRQEEDARRRAVGIWASR
jgi:hypothetical protein